jgi:hypothetical protein
MKEKSLLADVLLRPMEEIEVNSLFEKTVGAGALVSDAPEPKFVTAARSRAERMGISVDELLRRYSKMLKSSMYPSTACLTTSDVLAYGGGLSLSPERKEHVSTCAQCREVLAASLLSKEDLEALLEEVRILAFRAATGFPSRPNRRGNRKNQEQSSSVRERSLAFK